MICYADKTFCHRSNKHWCAEHNLEPCNNSMCHRHCWSIPKYNDLPVAYSDFSEVCEQYFNEVKGIACPFCGRKDFKVTARVFCKRFNTKANKFYADYKINVRCKCKLFFEGCIARNLEVGNKEELELAKMATIYRWNQRFIEPSLDEFK